MNLVDFNFKYEYKLDKNYDSWQKCEKINGKYYGDCESYILSLLDMKLAKGDITWTTINGEGHVVLVDRDRYIDCNNKHWTLIVDKPVSYGKFRKMYTVEVWLRKVKSKVLSFFYKDN